DGYLLVGRDSGAQWLMSHLVIGDEVQMEAKNRLTPIADAPSETVAMFLNPSHPDAQAYELGIVSELATNYDLDGITFDRMRYPSMGSDFSDLSRRQFGTWLGKPLERLPEDVYRMYELRGRQGVRGR